MSRNQLIGANGQGSVVCSFAVNPNGVFGHLWERDRPARSPSLLSRIRRQTNPLPKALETCLKSRMLLPIGAFITMKKHGLFLVSLLVLLGGCTLPGPVPEKQLRVDIEALLAF